MALHHDIITESGITIVRAYARVTSVSLASKHQMTFIVGWFVGPDHPMPAKTTAYACHHSMDNNCIAQAYMHLKELPEFANATDC